MLTTSLLIGLLVVPAFAGVVIPLVLSWHGGTVLHIHATYAEARDAIDKEAA